MTKRLDSDLDSRRDTDPVETPEEAVANHLVDRVFAPLPRAKPRETAAQAASALLAANRSVSATESTETEIALRRQLSRLQRQLSEAQRELADKDDELAGEVEKRQAAGALHKTLVGEFHNTRAEELADYRAHTAAIEARLIESVAANESLSHDLRRELEQRTAAQARAVEFTTALDDGQARWMAERGLLEQKHAEELGLLEHRKRVALDHAEEAISATAIRLREATEDQLKQLREAHELSIATLRGELEPKALESHNRAEEYERLRSELSKLMLDFTEREEAHKRELAQVVDSQASESTAQTRVHQAELGRVRDERDALAKALEQAKATAEQVDGYWQATSNELQEAEQRLQAELAETKERWARLDADRVSSEELLASAAENIAGLIAELAAAQSEVRRNEHDRRRFVAYLEEGLALLGALPPRSETEQPAAAGSARSDESGGAPADDDQR